MDTLIISRYLGKSSKIPEKVKVDSDRTDMIDNLFLLITLDNRLSFGYTISTQSKEDLWNSR